MSDKVSPPHSPVNRPATKVEAELAGLLIEAEQKLGNPSGGMALIRVERQRQILVEGFTPESDDWHIHGELASAAACYAMTRSNRAFGKMVDLLWPWDRKWWKPSQTDRIRELSKAGALCAAEIDRLQRNSKEVKSSEADSVGHGTEEQGQPLITPKSVPAPVTPEGEEWTTMHDELHKMIQCSLFGWPDDTNSQAQQLLYKIKRHADSSLSRLAQEKDELIKESGKRADLIRHWQKFATKLGRILKCSSLDADVIKTAEQLARKAKAAALPVVTPERMLDVERALNEAGCPIGNEHRNYSQVERIQGLGKVNDYCWRQLQELREKSTLLAQEKEKLREALDGLTIATSESKEQSQRLYAKKYPASHAG